MKKTNYEARVEWCSAQGFAYVTELQFNNIIAMVKEMNSFYDHKSRPIEMTICGNHVRIFANNHYEFQFLDAMIHGRI